MSPHHFFKKQTKNYYSYPHFAETTEYQVEKKIEKKVELFCNTLKYTFLKRKKNG